MNKFTSIALAALAAATLAPVAASAQDAPAASPAPSVNAGRMVYGANGQRIAAAYRVTAGGTVQVILDGKLTNIPASTLSEVDGKLTTSLTKRDLSRAR